MMKFKKSDLIRRALENLGENPKFPEVRDWILENHKVEVKMQDWKDSRRKKGESKSEDHKEGGKMGNNTIISLFPTSHIIPSNVFLTSLSLYGPSYGRLLCYLLLQAREEILLSHEVLASCHPYGFSAIQAGKKPNPNLSKDMIASLDKCPFMIHWSDFIANQACRTVQNFQVEEAILKEVANPSTKFVDLWTGKEVNSLAPEEGQPSSQPEVEALRQRLLAQNLDYSKSLSSKRDVILGIINCIPNIEERLKQLAIFNRIVLHPAPRYSAVDNSKRLYTTGPSFQNLTKAARNACFSGLRQFDLKQAQLMIISKLWDAPEILTYLNGQSIWSVLQSQTLLSKDALKRGVYTLIFGGTYNNAITNMAEVEGVPYYEVKQKISSCKFFYLLETASKRFTAKIKAEKSCLDAFGNELVTKDKLTGAEIRSIKGCQAQSYEVAIMLPVLTHLLDKGFQCWLLIHDGFITDNNSYMIANELKAIAESTGKTFGMSLSLEHELLS